MTNPTTEQQERALLEARILLNSTIHYVGGPFTEADEAERGILPDVQRIALMFLSSREWDASSDVWEEKLVAIRARATAALANGKLPRKDSL